MSTTHPGAYARVAEDPPVVKAAVIVAVIALALAPNPPNLLGTALFYAEAVVPVAMFAIAVREWWRFRQAQRVVRITAWLVLPLIAIAAAMITRAIVGTIPIEVSPTPTGPQVSLSSPLGLLLLCGFAVIAAFTREWFFRSWLFPRAPTLAALALNALLFALASGWGWMDLGYELRAHLAALFLGGVLVTARHLTGNTWYCVALAAAVSLLGLVTIQAA